MFQKASLNTKVLRFYHKISRVRDLIQERIYCDFLMELTVQDWYWQLVVTNHDGFKSYVQNCQMQFGENEILTKENNNNEQNIQYLYNRWVDPALMGC